MSKKPYRTTPDHESTAWPPGVPYIVGNEACERFSFYGMKSILFVHLAGLYVLAGETQGRAEDLATSTYHLFVTGVYALPLIGAIISDRWLGKYPTIIWLSLVYCAGHAVLAVADDTMVGMYWGLGLIAVGSGGIKPSVGAHVGDQFGKKNWFRVRNTFQIFYFSIMFSSYFSTLLIPFLRAKYGASVAFAIPGILMFIATWAFWLGRHKFVHVQPKPGGRLGILDSISSTFLFLTVGQLFLTASQPVWVIVVVGVICLAIGLGTFKYRQSIERDDGFLAVLLHCLVERGADKTVEHPAASDAQTPVQKLIVGSRFWRPAVDRYGLSVTEGPVAVLKVMSIFFLVSVFWALQDQHGSSWIRQAQMMNLEAPGWLAWFPLFGEQLLPSQIPSLNPLMVMGLIPLMEGLYRLSDRIGFKATPLRRMSIGMFIASLSFVTMGMIQGSIDSSGEGVVNVGWQVVPYLLITVAEVMVAITGLEFAYTQAPARMKSTMMGFWLLTVSLGNVFVALLARFGDLPLAQFFWFFAGLMAVAAVFFAARANFYQPQDYTQ